MGYEERVLDQRFDASRRDIQKDINYYCAEHLDGKSRTILDISPNFISDMEYVVERKGEYLGIYIEMKFVWEGSKQHWLGVTFVGDGPFRRREHYIGYIELDQVGINSDVPIDVRILCNSPLFYHFFRGMADYLLQRYSIATQEDIDAQKALLSAHRKTLQHYLHQEALHSKAYAPPIVTHGILDARRQIRHIKQILRNWGFQVDDHPNDEETSE